MITRPTVFEGSQEVRARRVVIQLETEEQSTTQQDDSILKSLSPLVNNMRLFGLYFTDKRRVGPSASGRFQPEVIRGCDRVWTASRIYATIMLAVIGINASRYYYIFDSRETVGADLFYKLGLISSSLLDVVLRCAYYVASHTGSLDRVFRRVELSYAADFSSRYSRRAKVVTVICWTYVSSITVYYICLNFVEGGHFDDPSLAFLVKTFGISKPYSDILRAVSVVLEVQALASWAFTQAMNCTFTSQNCSQNTHSTYCRCLIFVRHVLKQ